MSPRNAFRNDPTSRRRRTATVLPFTRSPAATPVSRAEIDRLVARGRRLQGEALRDGLRRAFRYLVGGCSLRGLRLPGGTNGQRQPCC